MATPVDFAGSNRRLVAAPGTEDQVTPLAVYTNGEECISCWKLTPEELAQVNATDGEVWISVLSGSTAPPIKIVGFPLMEAFDLDTHEKTTYYTDGRHIIEDARQFATLHHGDQVYGADKLHPYHLAKVAGVATDFKLPWQFIVACWLHDTEEDCWQDESIESRRYRIRQRYGEFVEKLVWAVTGQMYIDGVKQNRKARNTEQYLKILENPGSAFVKYCDRIGNMEECVAAPETGHGDMYLKELLDFDDTVGPLVFKAMRARLFRAALDIHAATGAASPELLTIIQERLALYSED